MNRISLFILSMCCVISARSQYVGGESGGDVQGFGFLSQSYIGLNLGFSSPTGDYGSDSRSNADAAFAQTGFHISLAFNKVMAENVGFSVLVGRSSHKMDDSKLENILQDAYPYSGNPPYNSLSWSVSAGTYSTTSFMGGLLVALPMENGFFDIRFLLGYAVSTLPSIRISVDDGNTFEEQIQYSSTKGAMAMNIGAGFRLHINHYLSLALNVDWYRTKPTFDQIVDSNFGYTSDDTYSMTMTMLNPSIGIGYRFY